VTTAGLTYTYDGDGKRVKKSNGKLYWYGMGADTLDESDASGNITDEFLFFGGKRIARRNVSSGNISYYFADHLGTSRVVTNSVGTVLDDSDFYPFGVERAVLSSSGNAYKFTGKERDSESALDNFGARYYMSSLGRFLRPDDPNADQDSSDPGSWNLYTYVRNNPLRFTDADGRACVQGSNGSFHDDNSGGQSCKDAQEPDKVEVKANAPPPSLPPTKPDGYSRLYNFLRSRGLYGCSSSDPCQVRGEIPIGPSGILNLSGAALEEANYMAKLSAILREAASSKGMGPGAGKVAEVTAAEAEELGKAWVGSGARVASDGKTLVSSDGLRVYRPPAFKPGLGKVQANLEQKAVGGGQPVSNFHLDVK